MVCAETGIVHVCGDRCTHAVVGPEGRVCTLTGRVLNMISVHYHEASWVVSI